MAPIAVIVEDDDGLRLIYNHVLKGMGFDVYEAADGREAMTLLESTTPQIMFLDMRLPFINGNDILKYVRETSRFDDTRIVVASSNHQEGEHLNAHLVEFILKPIRPAQIREIAGEVL